MSYILTFILCLINTISKTFLTLTIILYPEPPFFSDCTTQPLSGKYFILWDIVDPRTESNPNPNPNPEPNPEPNPKPHPNPNPKPNPNPNLILTADSLYLIR